MMMSVFRQRIEALVFALLFNGMAIGALLFFNPQLLKKRHHSVLHGVLGTKPTLLKAEQGNAPAPETAPTSTAMTDSGTRP